LGNNDTLSLKDLTLKLTALLALLTAQRISSISYLSVSCMHISNDKVVFIPVRLSKHHRQGKKIEPIIVSAYPKDSRLCVVKTLNVYLTRRPHPHDQLMLTHRKPHGPASTATVARWLKQVLKASGVDITVYSAHSYRGASTSAADFASVPMQEILRRGEWSSETTWRNHYQLLLQPVTREDEDDFTEQLLDSYPPSHLEG
jgi:hypothetical protein